MRTVNFWNPLEFDVKMKVMFSNQTFKYYACSFKACLIEDNIQKENWEEVNSILQLIIAVDNINFIQKIDMMGVNEVVKANIAIMNKNNVNPTELKAYIQTTNRTAEEVIEEYLKNSSMILDTQLDLMNNFQNSNNFVRLENLGNGDLNNL